MRAVATSVLIVDDEEDMRVLVRAIVSGDGITVAGEAADGTQALAQLEAVDPAVVVLDQMMPGMTGLETARLILERRPNQAIVLFSAFLSDELRAEASAIGVSACLTKDQVGRIAEAIRSVA
jgi:two-component system, chemotaxis family, chemotaxis protein CheY